MRNDLPILPAILAVLVHALLLASTIFAFDFSGRQRPQVPLAVKATLVSQDDIQTVREPEPEPEPIIEEPEPEPVVEEPEPEPPQPDPAEIRRQQEEAARLEEQRAEAERVRQQQLREEQERIRREQEAERERRAREEAERKRREEAELERRRQEAERKRQEEIERQRRENERLKREAEEAERRRRLEAELAEEARRLEAMESGEMARYLYAIQQKITRNWIMPASVHPGIECVALVRQLPGGDVVSVQIERCNGDEAVRRSIEAAIHKASPLPQPENAALFDRNLRITVKPEQ